MKKQIAVFLWMVALVPAMAGLQGEPPEAAAILKGFKADTKVEQTLSDLRKKGWTVGEPTTLITRANFGDEGVDGTYLVSLYCEKGARPFSQSHVVAAVVTFSAGFIGSVTLVDTMDLSEALLKL